jgi:hypothetical protein
MKSNGLPGGYTNLNGGHPGLSEDRLEGVIVIEVFPTSLGPKVIKDKAMEDVQRLPGVCEAA